VAEVAAGLASAVCLRFGVAFVLFGRVDGGGMIRGVGVGNYSERCLDREAAQVSLQPSSEAVMVATRSAALIAALARRQAAVPAAKMWV